MHARSIVACAFDAVTGEIVGRRLGPSRSEVGAWIGALPGPVAVVYEADPTGFALARFVTAAGGAVRGCRTLEASAPERGSDEDRRP